MHYGKYRAIVKETDDPEKRGRIKVSCPSILGKQLSNWALPCLPPSIFGVPAKDSLVWVEFEGGNKDSPIWSGIFYTTDGWQSLFKTGYDPKKVVIRSFADFDLRAGAKMFLYSNNDAYINNTGDTGKTIMGTIESLGIKVNGVNVALVGYPISGTGYQGASVSGKIDQG
jgi:hypothetical protein